MEDQGGLVNLILKIRFGSTIECVWPKLMGLIRIRKVAIYRPSQSLLGRSKSECRVVMTLNELHL